VLFYKANGRKAIKHMSNTKPTPTTTGSETLSATLAAAASVFAQGRL